MIETSETHTDVSETGKVFFFIGAKSSKILDFRSRFQINTEIVLVDEFHRNRCQNEALGLNFQEKFWNSNFHHIYYHFGHFEGISHPKHRFPLILLTFQKVIHDFRYVFTKFQKFRNLAQTHTKNATDAFFNQIHLKSRQNSK